MRNLKKELEKSRNVSYTNKDFLSLRNDLKSYVATHFADTLSDVSDASFAGVLIDLAAYVGDVMSYYIDFQFNETSLERATDPQNIESLAREAGVDRIPVSPAYVELDLKIKILAVLSGGEYIPDSTLLPVIKAESQFQSRSGVSFYLLNDVDFSERDSMGNLKAKIEIAESTTSAILYFFLTLKSYAASSVVQTQTYAISDSFVPFREIIIQDPNVNEIISVMDSMGDEYYQVESLTQDTVFKRSANTANTTDDAKDTLYLAPAPKRFVLTRSQSGVSLIFGGGDENNFENASIPDPSEYSLKMWGDRKTLSRVAIDPSSFLQTRTLGVSPQNTTLTVRYRTGGGLSHNVRPNQITSVKKLITTFTSSILPSTAANIRSSLQVTNQKRALGGENEISLEQIRNIAILNKNSQNRVVTKEDLIARIYTLPTNFGRCFRASAAQSPVNPDSTCVYVISRDNDGKLALSSDAYKKNLANYLSSFRLVSDSIEIYDCPVLNFSIVYKISIKEGANEQIVLSEISRKLTDLFSKNIEIDKPISLSEIEIIIHQSPDVSAILDIDVQSITGLQNGREYADNSFSKNYQRGQIRPPPGGIFELRYPEHDIKGSVE